jgi:hypothetical protein
MMQNAMALHRRRRRAAVATLALAVAGCAGGRPAPDGRACFDMTARGLRPIAETRTDRVLGKVALDTARCRGGDAAVEGRGSPYVDWTGYWGAGDASSLAGDSSSVADGANRSRLSRDGRGIDGALIDLEYQRIELLEFNLFDNAGTYRRYVEGRAGAAGPALGVFDEMRLPPAHPAYRAVGGSGAQVCTGNLIRFRTLDGICNDVRNPRMGATGMPFARNVEFDATFPDLARNELARNRHDGRIGLLRPDPQVVSRKLLTRAQSQPARCNAGEGMPDDSPAAHCDYRKAPALNVLAAFWIQFMTHDWFSHLEEGRNAPGLMEMGCTTMRVANAEMPLASGERARLGCREGDRVDPGMVAEDTDPGEFAHGGKRYLTRAWRTTRNNVTAWWDASQMYGYDARSLRRVKRDPHDPAKLMLIAIGSDPEDDTRGYLPVFDAADPINPQWAGQEATAFGDSWSIGLSFFHNLFAREHNAFVDAFRRQAAATPDADCGLRDPARPDAPVRYRDVTPPELFEIARLVVAAEIAKIHTTEWTPQLLYDEPLYRASTANWSGLLAPDDDLARALAEAMARSLGASESPKKATQWYSVLASGPGIVGLGSRVPSHDPPHRDAWNMANPDHVNGGVNHFGSPFNFPEEFVTVYRLHALVPDLIEYRDVHDDPNVVRRRIALVHTARGDATQAMREHGLANWAVSMGRQRAGALTLGNHPQFLQNLALPRLRSATGKVDIAALDLVRDRERGVPRYNEFRRQYGLRQLRSFDDFVDPRVPAGSPQRQELERWSALLREVYGQHRCDSSRVITDAQRSDDGTPIDDCLGFPDGSVVDNIIEDLDTVVGWLAESRRPHGSAISETQLQVFILNASRRLFSDRFFTSSFRPELYTTFGLRWVMENGADGRLTERARSNGHEVEASPLKRVLLRNIPELRTELAPVINAFDPWARDRGRYYSLQWRPRAGAERDPAFAE